MLPVWPKQAGQSMAVAAADLWLRHVAVRLAAAGRDLNTSPKERRNRTTDARPQREMLAAVCARDPRNRARRAEVSRPGLRRRLQQPALLHILAAEVIAVEPGAFVPGRCSHPCRIRKPRLDASNVFPAARIDSNGVSHVDEVRALHDQAGICLHLLRHTGGGVTADRHLRAHHL